ncbi:MULTISPECIES: TRAP transporter small permease [Alphaproteobacteria]|uniref:TRAP transporter small permease n=1 Tax=Alphaproteobacteria TaxID=28211 RepID=UPI0030ECD328|tara:strand:+ start:41137 stop:41607 length:471 start_codon:yes stop_codon:yes gene_type:complete
MSTFCDKFSLQLARVTNVIVVVLSGVMMLALVLQVFSRYVIGATFIWTEELAMFCFTWSILLAATSILRDGSHVSLDFIVKALPERLENFWKRIIDLAVLAFFIVFAVAGAEYLQTTFGQVSPALRLPMAWINVAAPVCGTLGCIHTFCRIITPRP